MSPLLLRPRMIPAGKAGYLLEKPLKINKFEMTKSVGAMHAQTQGLATGSGEVVVIVVPRIGSAGANLTAPALPVDWPAFTTGASPARKPGGINVRT